MLNLIQDQVALVLFFLPKFRLILISENEIHSFDIHAEKIVELTDFLPSNRPLSIILTSGASCPDSIVDGVIQRILALTNPSVSAEEALLQFLR